jgi:hypothetical protein
MKICQSIWKISTIVLAMLLVAVVGWSSVRSANADKQPLMHKALSALQEAKTALSNATHDKGGHRVKALALTNEAIEQVKKGIAYDNNR